MDDLPPHSLSAESSHALSTDEPQSLSAVTHHFLADEPQSLSCVASVPRWRRLTVATDPPPSLFGGGMNFEKIVECSQQLEKKYLTREELLSSVKRFFLMQGYVVSIKSSRKDKYVTIGCDRGGCYRDRLNIPMEQRQRKSATRLINCPFEIKGKRQMDGFWTLEFTNSLHNHEPSTDMSGHPTCRRLSKEDVKSVHEMSVSGIAPRQIISSLRQNNPNLQVVSKTIYNTKSKIYKEKLGGRTSIQALFEELGQGSFIYNLAQDESGHLTHLIFAHPMSITLTRNFFNVFIMDCTYKTNKYKMPLLDIVGISCFNTSFYSCFAFLSKEGEEDYIWALENFSKILGPGCQPSVIVSDRELALMKAIRVVFPNTHNILCVWHINKNIVSNCKHHFEVQEVWDSFLSTWNLIVQSTDEASFEESWLLFELLYKGKEEVLSYIRRTWLPFKDRFIGAWTEKYLHLGNRVSSRAEGAHSKLKKYLHNSSGDLCQVKDKICLAIKNEFEEIKTQLSSEKLRISHSVNIPFFKELNTHVSMFAMKELLKQYEMVKLGKMPSTCTGNFTSTMGLPCSHKMISLKDGTLPLSSIHSQWRIDISSLTSNFGEITNEEGEFEGLLNEFQDKYFQWPLVRKENAREKISQLIGASLPYLEPNVEAHKGRPSKKQKQSLSTKRDPSKFEIVEANRRCSTCKGVGHNSRTCQGSGSF